MSTVTGGVTYNTKVASVDSSTQLTVGATSGVTVWDVIGKTYNIYRASDIKEAEKVSNSKITMLSNSILTAPNLTFPAYAQEGDFLDSYPNTISNIGQLISQYIRFPFAPKWTFITLASGEPVFDSGSADYQDFELPLDDEVNLVNKILQYAGMSIREIQAVQFAQAEDNENTASEK